MHDFKRITDLFMCNEDSHKGYITEIDVRCLKEVYDLQSGVPFFLKRIHINKCEKLACSLYSNKNYAIHMGGLKQAQDHELIL